MKATEEVMAIGKTFEMALQGYPFLRIRYQELPKRFADVIIIIGKKTCKAR